MVGLLVVAVALGSLQMPVGGHGFAWHPLGFQKSSAQASC